MPLVWFAVGVRACGGGEPVGAEGGGEGAAAGYGGGAVAGGWLARATLVCASAPVRLHGFRATAASNGECGAAALCVVVPAMAEVRATTMAVASAVMHRAPRRERCREPRSAALTELSITPKAFVMHCLTMHARLCFA